MKKFSKNIVIGNGIMAKQLMFELNKLDEGITCVSSEDFAPACSVKSTAINCLRGTKPGTSELGDLILEGHAAFESFFNDCTPDGITESLEVQTWKEFGDTHDKWVRRYGEYVCRDELAFSKTKLQDKLCNVNTKAYLISPDVLYSWYDKKLSSIGYVDGFVIDIQKNEVGYKLVLHSGDELSCERLFICASYMAKKFSYLCQNEKDKVTLEKQKSVIGNYLSYSLKEGEDCGFNLTSSFSFSYDFIRLVYRKETHDFVMSFSDLNKDAFVLSKGQLKDRYESFVKQMNLTLMPEFNSFKLNQGVRSKGHKRVPFSKKVNDNLFITSGLYKNAFVFSYLFSKKIVQNL